MLCDSNFYERVGVETSTTKENMKHLTVTAEDAANQGGDFFDYNTCIVATALKRVFGEGVYFNVCTFKTNGKKYEIENYNRPQDFYFDNKLEGKTPFIIKYKEA